VGRSGPGSAVVLAEAAGGAGVLKDRVTPAMKPESPIMYGGNHGNDVD